MKVSGWYVLSAVLLLLASHTSAAEVKSPDGNVIVAFKTGEQGELLYSLGYRGKLVVLESRLGLELQDAPSMDASFRVVNVTHSTHDETWKPVYGERSVVRDHYNQMLIELSDDRQPPRRLSMTFRAYDEGAAFCYAIPKQDPAGQIHITKENSEFRFASDHRSWAVYSAQGRYEETTVGSIKNGCERPLVVEIDKQAFVAVGEARLVDYARMKLGPLGGTPLALVSQLTRGASGIVGIKQRVGKW